MNAQLIIHGVAIGVTLLTSTGEVLAKEKEIPWSFRPLYRPAMPAPLAVNWVKDDLDRFILVRLEAKGIQPNPDAGREVLLRRATYDLTGLPPTEREMDDFLQDRASNDAAFAKVVDRLLQSPRFGERWGRHWLDVVRYSDSVGRTMNAAFPFARRYRDYVIDAFNQDKPYHRFIAEQVAGDLLPASTPAQRSEQLIATGLLTMASLDLSEGGELFRLDRVDDQIDVTTRAFMGLTISCARCHDHKTDPVTQRDYYALAGIFYSTQTWSGQRPKGNLGANGYVDEEALLRVPVAKQVASAAVASVDGKGASGQSDMEEDGGSMAAMEMTQPSRGYPVYFRYDPTRAMGVEEGEMEDCPIAIKGDAYDRGEAPARGALAIPQLPKFPAVDAKASGRTELVRWLTKPNHPLTARVMVNRIWQHLFGRGIVRSVDDFGQTGDAPTHPELLDHLAVRFVEKGWSVKGLIRTVMLSRTYRMSSRGDPVREQADGANELFWKMNSRRLEVEAIRDSLFFVAGTPVERRPTGVQVAGFGGKGREARLRSLVDEDEPYRSVYLPVLRSLLSPMQETFDFPDPSQIKGQREVTTVSPQALFLMNGELTVKLAQEAADRLVKDETLRDDTARVQAGWRRVLGRKPDAQEVQAAMALMKDLSGSGLAGREVWAAFLQGLLCSAEFRYLL
ncbi:DUF1549 and DUF1553 domain-containing protein [Verrucomicrobium spinosum]|uniref:DUF1549 and DUF1553 domain-containing protein n=1 Tax=Verrucomicrobium spinosum TaxID=2736 RepID=UPI0001744753|nr:DUF1549 and DUF1553 domain-containing protein [Verrucomicrobium spinosum]